jgi:uncharacterized membrane protein
MKFHPVVFVLIAYGITAVIAVGVYFIVKVIALAVRRKDSTPAPGAGPENKGGAAP